MQTLFEVTLNFFSVPAILLSSLLPSDLLWWQLRWCFSTLTRSDLVADTMGYRVRFGLYKGRENPKNLGSKLHGPTFVPVFASLCTRSILSAAASGVWTRTGMCSCPQQEPAHISTAEGSSVPLSYMKALFPADLALHHAAIQESDGLVLRSSPQLTRNNILAALVMTRYCCFHQLKSVFKLPTL